MPPAPTLPIPGGDEKVMDFDDKPMTAEEARQSRVTAMSQAKDRLTRMTSAEANRLAYKDMKASLYYFSTFAFYGIVIIGAIFIPSVSIVLDFIGAFAASMLAFGFPALFYMGAKKRFGKFDTMYVKMSYIYYCLGILNCILGLTSTFLAILGGEHGH